MAMESKTLRTGQVKNANAAFCPGARVLYAAPNPAEPFGPVPTKAALVTGMRFFNTNGSGVVAVTINVYFVRYNQNPMHKRPTIRILPLGLSLESGQVIEDDIRLTLEAGDAILGDASRKTL